MNYIKLVNKQVVVIWLVCFIGISVIAHLIIPSEYRSSIFYHRLSWALFLFSICWYNVADYFSSTDIEEGVSQRSRVAVATTYVIIISSIISFCLMSIHTFSPQFELINRWHKALQIVVICAAFILIGLFNISSFAANRNMPASDVKIPSPKFIHDNLSQYEALIPNVVETKNIRAAIKSLKINLLHSITFNKSLSCSEVYLQLNNEIETFCKELDDMLSKFNQKNYASIDNLSKRCQRLAISVKLVSKNQTR